MGVLSSWDLSKVLMSWGTPGKDINCNYRMEMHHSITNLECVRVTVQDCKSLPVCSSVFVGHHRLPTSLSPTPCTHQGSRNSLHTGGIRDLSLLILSHPGWDLKGMSQRL